jgi:hypothetical protein
VGGAGGPQCATGAVNSSRGAACVVSTCLHCSFTMPGGAERRTQAARLGGAGCPQRATGAAPWEPLRCRATVASATQICCLCHPWHHWTPC